MNKVARKVIILIICGAMLLGLLAPMFAHASESSNVNKTDYTVGIEEN